MISALILVRSTFFFYPIEVGEILGSQRLSGLLKWVFYGLKFECMLIGAVGAYLAFNGRLTRYALGSPSLLMYLAILMFLLHLNTSFGIVNDLIYSALYILIMLNLAFSPKSVSFLEHQFFKTLGRLSYGVYLWHSLGIVISLEVLEPIFDLHKDINVALLYVSTFFLTSALAYLSNIFI